MAIINTFLVLDNRNWIRLFFFGLLVQIICTKTVQRYFAVLVLTAYNDLVGVFRRVFILKYESDKESGTLVAGIYPFIYEMDESPTIVEVGRILSDLDIFVIVVWVELWLYPEASYGEISGLEVLSDGTCLSEGDCGRVAHTIEDIPEDLRERFVALVVSDMEQFKENGMLEKIAEGR